MKRSNEPVESSAYLESVIPQNRLDFLRRLCDQTLRRVAGNILEIGVYRGGSLKVLTETLIERCPRYRVTGVDTYSGHPYSDGHWVHPAGKYSDVDITTLLSQLDVTGLSSYVTLVAGKVEDVLNHVSFPNLAFIHVDCDLYVPVRAVARHLYSELLPGGVIYFDDYGHDHCPGATRAVDSELGHLKKHEVTMADGTAWSCFFVK